MKKLVFILALALGMLSPAWASYFANGQFEAVVIGISGFTRESDGRVTLQVECRIEKVIKTGGQNPDHGKTLVGTTFKDNLILNNDIVKLSTGDRFILDWSYFDALTHDGTVQATRWTAQKLLALPD